MLNTRRTSKVSQAKAVIGGLVIVVLAVVAVVGASQLDVIREYFTQASGEPANIVIDTQAVLGPLPRPWRHLAQGGEAYDWRLQPLTTQVAALEPEYIRIDHIYDFYEIVQGSPGNLTFDFSKLDPILDDIAATGAKPYIALSYMPPAISRGDIIDAPVNWADWQLTVQRTVEHISGARGTRDVYYEVWNEPDLFGDWKYYGDKNYLDLYTYAAIGANRASGVQPFKIGGPATTALYRNWFDALAQHVIRNNLRLDFISWHRYSHDLDVFTKDMQEARTWLSFYPQLEPTTELHITEWGPDSENNAVYDSGYSAAHTVAASLEMIGVVDRAFVFEIQDGKDPAGQTHWGRWGLFTAADVGAQAKPRYHGLRFLNQLGDQRLQTTGEGYWVKGVATTDSEDETGTITTVLANFDRLGAHAESVPVTFENIEPGNYSITRRALTGQTATEQVATTAAVLQTIVPMPVNSVVLLELTPQ